MDDDAATLIGSVTGSATSSGTTLELKPYRLPSRTPKQAPFTLPSIHSWPPFFTQQRNPSVLAQQTALWARLILSYARHRRLFVLRPQDAENRIQAGLGNEAGSEWTDVFWNPRIGRILKRPHLETLMRHLVVTHQAIYETDLLSTASSSPFGLGLGGGGGAGTGAVGGGGVVLYWRTPEEWAEVVFDWVSQTGQLSTILTFYELTDPDPSSPPSELSGLPVPLLRKALAVLSRSGRAQVIEGNRITGDGEGVRFFAR